MIPRWVVDKKDNCPTIVSYFTYAIKHNNQIIQKEIFTSLHLNLS